MSVRRSDPTNFRLPADAADVARHALAEARLRGLAAAEEYRVIADRLYRSGFRDLPPGALVGWIEQEVGENYEHFLNLRSLGDRLHTAIASGDFASAAWVLACEADPDSQRRLAAGLQRLCDMENVGNVGNREP